MRIAFASYEYPQETGGGGIGTYLETVAKVLRADGHSVVVFCATHRDTVFWDSEIVYRIPARNWQHFDEELAVYFSAEHVKLPFDVLEATDFCAAGLSVKKVFPELPTVVRLHTPLYLVDRLLYRPPSAWTRLRMSFGALRRLEKPARITCPDPKHYQREFDLVERCERVSAPSVSIAEELKQLGFAVDGKTDIVPLPFDASPFLNLTSRKNIDTSPHIVFFGRMEYRKGVLDLAAAIPIILKTFPNALFSFIGQAAESPIKGIDMKAYLQKILQRNNRSVSFPGRLTRSELIAHLQKGDVFVFPSHYESFGLALCEAMAAGKAVIASRNGGMGEIVEDGISGLLVNPKQPKELAEKIISACQNNSLRLALGVSARERIQQLLSPKKVLQQQLNCYQQAIKTANKQTIQPKAQRI